MGQCSSTKNVPSEVEAEGSVQSESSLPHDVTALAGAKRESVGSNPAGKRRASATAERLQAELDDMRELINASDAAGSPYHQPLTSSPGRRPSLSAAPARRPSVSASPAPEVSGASARRPSVSGASARRPSVSAAPARRPSVSAASVPVAPEGDDLAQVELLVQQRASVAATNRKSTAPSESIGSSIIESGRASVRRNSIGATTPVNSPATPATSSRRPSVASDADARRDARRARFAAALEEDLQEGPPTPSASTSSPKADEPSVGLSLVERQLAARRSARRASVAAPTVTSPSEPKAGSPTPKAGAE